MSETLTASEESLIKRLPQLPDFTIARVTHIWIIEWLSPGERQTGKELHEWMEKRWPGWSIYHQCTSKDEIIRSIKRAAYLAQHSGILPILHIEAHGGLEGLAPSRNPGVEFLSWTELTMPLQLLNTAMKCNLILVVAACIGFASIQALTEGPRAPVVAMVGLDAEVNDQELLLGTKEFYRRFKDEEPRLSFIAESASREIRAASFEIEPFATLAYEGLVETLIMERRPDKRKQILERLRQRLSREYNFSEKEIQNRLAELPETVPPTQIQQQWDYMFMIDIEPSNEERFGLDWQKVINDILAVPVS